MNTLKYSEPPLVNLLHSSQNLNSPNRFSQMSKLHNVAHDASRRVIIILATFVLTVFVFPASCILLIPSLIFRLIVGIIARIFRPDLAGHFSGKRVMFAFESIYKKPQFTILLHFVFDGSLPAEQIRLAFQQRILNYYDESGKFKYLHLQQTWAQFLGFVFWKWEKNFNLNHHIRDYDYQDKNRMLPDICTEADLQRVTPDLISKPFKEGTSPWEMLVIPHYRAANNTTGTAQSVATFRVHHALADGYSILKLLFKAFDWEAATVPKPNFPRMSLARRIWMSYVIPFRLPFDLATHIVDGFDWGNSWHLVDKKYSRKYHAFFSDQVPLDQIKEIKNKFCVNYNVAALAIAIGGIRRLMVEAGQEIPRSMACFVPIPLPNHPGGLVVHATGFCFRLSPQIHSPVERIQQIGQSTRVFNNAPSAPIALSWGSDVLHLLPAFVIKFFYYYKFTQTLTITSFPGPEGELDVMGSAKLVDIIPAIGHPPGYLGAAGVLLSMAGKQRFVLTVDQAIFESYDVPVKFARHINDEIQDLLHSNNKTT